MKRALYALWLAAILALIVLHAVHPRADFPASAPWKDFAKYTDEGWYSKAAVDHFATGSWYVPGGFNPAVALPILPVIEFAVFSITGPGLTAARLLLFVVFAANLLLVYFVVRTQAPRWIALLAVTILAASAFVYVFSRLVILEPLMLLFLFASWIIALRLPAQPRTRNLACIACGLLLCLMVLAKTTSVVLLPSTFFLLWIYSGPAFASRLKAIAVTALSALVPWCAYYFLFVRPHYLADYRYLFIANQWPVPATLAGRLAIFRSAFFGTFAIDRFLMLLALFLSVPLVFRAPRRNPLVIASLIAVSGYLTFMGWHSYIQPRYYLAVVYPLVIALALGLHRLVTALRAEKRKPVAALLTIATMAAAAILVFSTAANLFQVLRWTTHPQYTWFNAANGVTSYIDHHPNGNRLLLSSSSDEITLATGLLGICDYLGTSDILTRASRYQPGWYATWNNLDPKFQAALETRYHLEQVAAFHAFTDPGHDLLILYKLHPLTPGK